MFHHRRVLERHLDISAESPAVTGIPLSCLRHLPRVARVNSLGRAIKSQDRRASLNSPLKCSSLPSRNSFVPSHRRRKHRDRRDVHRFLGSVSRRKLGERRVCPHIVPVRSAKTLANTTNLPPAMRCLVHSRSSQKTQSASPGNTSPG